MASQSPAPVDADTSSAEVVVGTESDIPSPPLSWCEARNRLKKCLQEYVDESTKQQRRRRRRQPENEQGHRNSNRNEQNKAGNERGFILEGDNDDNANNNDNVNGGDGDRRATRDGVDDIDDSPFVRKCWWLIFKWDLDIWIGCVGSCIAVLIIASLAMADDSDIDSNGRDPDSGSGSNVDRYREFARSQLAGSILIAIGCATNVWAVIRYRFSASQGTDGIKRRMIARFLRNLEAEEEENFRGSNKHHHQKRHINNNSNHKTQTLPTSITDGTGIDLVGTSLTDIYPVYRVVPRSGNDEATGRGNRKDGDQDGEEKEEGMMGSWSRIPTLLLVRGDRIALQVGDAAPCKCRVVEGRRASSVFETGDIITIGQCTGDSVSNMIAGLPRGRTTFPTESDELLNVCNNMKVFEVMETPVASFLREKEKDPKSPQILRQLQTVRSFMSMAGIGLFILAFVILLARSLSSAQSSQRQIYYLLPTPFLVVLSTCGFVGPLYLIFIESLGTSRILASYHPVASRNYLRRQDGTEKPNVDILILRYFFAALSNRFCLQDLGRALDRWLLKCQCIGNGRHVGHAALVRVPPASLYLLEKLGVATALTVVDDELVCEPQAVPQQLLIPSGKGLKLLDLCPTYEDDSDDDNEDENDDASSSMEFRRARQRSFDAELNYDSDSDSDDLQMKDHHHVPNRRKPRRRLVRKAFRVPSQKRGLHDDDGSGQLEDNEVQFEDPMWWQQLPSLKCIGLGCLLVDPQNETKIGHFSAQKSCQDQSNKLSELGRCKKELVRLISEERRSNQLRALARCIGFSTKPNYAGVRGDISPFIEKLRMHVISAAMVGQRLEIDTHERGSEDSRWWGLLRSDSTSVIVQDNRSGAYQLLTVGDPKVVTRMCHEAWQGENSTILPLAAQDRATVIETSDNWKLADLDVEAFSYAPIPHTFETRSGGNQNSKIYLLDNDSRIDPLVPYQKDKAASAEWSLLNNQIFLGILGSLVIPRQETQGLLSTLQDAGVRFVYFSPRNMRRQKEIASQMGIDVAWNCAISLRPLDKGEEDTHRMVSDYADWDVNAKLPHGIESVRRHLVDVDNVPLLVSLFTDVTKTSTMEMIDIFKEYNDTVIAVGLSHLPRNCKIFSSADLAIGVDVLSEGIKDTDMNGPNYHSLLPSEVTFASAVSAHNCAFRLSGVTSMEHIPTILAQGRASLSASVSACVFVVSSFLSFGFYSLFTVFSLSVTIPYIPLIGAFLFLQAIVPLIAIPMAMSDSDQKCMQEVPPKNDLSVSFGKKEHGAFFRTMTLKSVFPAILSQLVYLIAFGELMIAYEDDNLQIACPSSERYQPGQWTRVIRCSGLRGYSGQARDMASVLSLTELTLCSIVVSMSFLYRVSWMRDEPPWHRNHLWCFSVAVCLSIVAVYLHLNLADGAISKLPWYFSFITFFIIPTLCVAADEFLKQPERRVMERSEKLRRLQFETRLGMWSPK